MGDQGWQDRYVVFLAKQLGWQGLTQELLFGAQAMTAEEYVRAVHERTEQTIRVCIDGDDAERLAPPLG